MPLSLRQSSVAIFLAACLSQPAHARSAAALPKAPETANGTAIAIYLPPASLTSRSYSPYSRMWIEPGRALDTALREVGRQFFSNAQLIDRGKPRGYGLLIDFSPTWSMEAGRVRLSLQYDVYAASGAKVHGATQVETASAGASLHSAMDGNTRRALHRAFADVLAVVKPDSARFPDSGSTSSIDFGMLVDKSKPYRTGTGFFINAAGQLLTAAHVQRDCTVLEARQKEQTFKIEARAASDLLDVAVLDSGHPTTVALPLRAGQAIVLGEAVTSVGYPLQGLLAESPNLTRGNISAETGVKGSYGMFQFSAPIQPGNSGGPIVSDSGELLGMAVSTLRASSLVERGLLPQNINFALDARHVSSFLKREKIAFTEVSAGSPGSMANANNAALQATVQLNCYQ